MTEEQKRAVWLRIKRRIIQQKRQIVLWRVIAGLLFIGGVWSLLR